MFNNVLIANRGEIACRIMRTAKRMGITSVAVYSDVDENSLHVKSADFAVPLGRNSPEDTYLNIHKILEVSRQHKIEAIHPGYGFLSENEDFAMAVKDAGIEFIGPSSQSIRRMGQKNLAKRLMQEAGVPVVPGYHGANQDNETLMRHAEEIGFPLLIKAVAGGGGRGMRVVSEATEFELALAGSRAEARAAFGEEAVLLERLIGDPRHIEVQIFGDKSGNVVHLFERDCSLQRRNQKVLEESPAPGISAQVRESITEAAIRAANAVDYFGAGTVEFIADNSDGLRQDRIWFMEMNTRLQVEHPVTELVTGIDLVEWQFRIASGENLPLTQSEISLEGHAIEARLYGEDVAGGYLPAVGQINRLNLPESIRVDSGIRRWDRVTHHYDSMLAKIVSHGETRDAARDILLSALNETVLSGVQSNVPFLGAILRQGKFGAGEVSTRLIEREIGPPCNNVVPPTSVLAVAAFALISEESTIGWDTGFCLWNQQPQPICLNLGPRSYRISYLIEQAGKCQVFVGEESCLIESCGYRVIVDGKATKAIALVYGGEVSVFWDGMYRFSRFTFSSEDVVTTTGTPEIKSSMPGLVTSVLIEKGQLLRQGQRIAVVEAMKMEHVIFSTNEGRIARVSVCPGQQIDSGDVIATFESNS